MFHNRFTAIRLRHCMLADNPASDQGGGDAAGDNAHGDSAAGQNADVARHDGNGQDGQSRDFSRALSKRIAQIEAKYSDYEQLKEKAAKWDAQESDKQSDMDKLAERLTAIEQERDRLKATEQHRQTIAKISEETGLDPKIAALLDGDDEQALTDNAKALAAWVDSIRPKKPRGPKAAGGGRRVGETDGMSPMDLLRDAYSE